MYAGEPIHVLRCDLHELHRRRQQQQQQQHTDELKDEEGAVWQHAGERGKGRGGESCTAAGSVDCRQQSELAPLLLVVSKPSGLPGHPSTATPHHPRVSVVKGSKTQKRERIRWCGRGRSRNPPTQRCLNRLRSTARAVYCQLLLHPPPQLLRCAFLSCTAWMRRRVGCCSLVWTPQRRRRVKHQWHLMSATRLVKSRQRGRSKNDGREGRGNHFLFPLPAVSIPCPCLLVCVCVCV